MLWQYRTILFEFTKDGLLGDKYVDDEEMEKNLNELGAQEWELVSVSLLQDGLLAFLKRPGQEEEVEVEMPPSRTVASVAPAVVQSRPEVYSRSVIAAEPIEEEEPEPIRGLDRQRKSTLQREDTDFVGDIKIS